MFSRAAHLRFFEKLDPAELHLYPSKFGIAQGRRKREEGRCMKPDEAVNRVMHMKLGRTHNTLKLVVVRSPNNFLKDVRC